MRKHLQKARQAHDLTQQAVADRLGVGLRMYQHMELGTRTGRYQLWQELAAMLDTEQDTLRIVSTNTIPDPPREHKANA